MEAFESGIGGRSKRQRALELVAAGDRLSRDRLVLPGEGNLSFRSAADRVVVTPSGCDKGRLRVCDLVEVPLEGPVPARASIETVLHTAIYRACPEVMAVVHAHPPVVLRLDAAGHVPDIGLLGEAELVLGLIGTVAYAPPGSAELADGVARVARRAPVCVLQRHGAVTVGQDMATALRRMLVLSLVANAMEGALVGR